MPEAFKHNFSTELVINLGNMLALQLPEFEQQHFVDSVLSDFECLELKQRSARITDVLCDVMPKDHKLCKSVIEAVLHPEDISEFSASISDEKGLRGWVIMPLADFVSRRWLNHDFIEGLKLLKKLTRCFSAEFAIRDFIAHNQSEAFSEITSWLDDSNEHVRRLASEGTRPRLPWGKQLSALVADPSPLAVILEKLLDDESEYVRRSVANNLNDIAKDNPDFVMKFVARHKVSDNKNRMRLLKHACRSLIKQGDADILSLFGFHGFYGEVRIKDMPQQVEWGGQFYFEVEITSGAAEPQNLMLDYVIWHQKANGEQTPKVFKWKVIEDFTGEGSFKKKHSFKPVTTRKYYAGEHKIEIQINGQRLCSQSFELIAHS